MVTVISGVFAPAPTLQFLEKKWMLYSSNWVCLSYAKSLTDEPTLY